MSDKTGRMIRWRAGQKRRPADQQNLESSGCRVASVSRVQPSLGIRETSRSGPVCRLSLLIHTKYSFTAGPRAGIQVGHQTRMTFLFGHWLENLSARIHQPKCTELAKGGRDNSSLWLTIAQITPRMCRCGLGFCSPKLCSVVPTARARLDVVFVRSSSEMVGTAGDDQYVG